MFGGFLGSFVTSLNNQYNEIKFTVKIEGEGKLPFLDIMIMMGHWDGQPTRKNNSHKFIFEQLKPSSRGP